MKCLVINLSREVKVLYIENYKILMKKTEKGTNKRKDILSCIEKINIVKISIPLKAVYKLNAFPIKILMAVFTEI